MKRGKTLVLVLLVVLSLILVTACTAKPEEPDFGDGSNGEEEEPEVKYPEKPVTAIIPFGPGGGSDILTRAIQKYLDFDIVPVNIEGAGGLVGAQEAYRADNDGYTILAHNPMNLISQSLSGADSDGIWEKLRTICFMVDDYTVVSTNSKTGWKNLDDMLDYAKANPGKLKWGTTGSQSISMAEAISITEALEIDCTLVPYEGGAETRTALLGNHIQIETSTGSDIRSVVESGDVVPLFVVAPNRSPFLPDVKTVKEYGIDITTGAPRAYYAPAGTPEEVLKILEEEFRKVCENEEFIEYVAELGLEARFVGIEESERIAREWYEKYKPIFDRFE